MPSELRGIPMGIMPKNTAGTSPVPMSGMLPAMQVYLIKSILFFMFPLQYFN